MSFFDDEHGTGEERRPVEHPTARQMSVLRGLAELKKNRRPTEEEREALRTLIKAYDRITS